MASISTAQRNLGGREISRAAQGWRTGLATLAAVIFAAFAALGVAAMPQGTQIGCRSTLNGQEYINATWASRTCADWYNYATPGGPHYTMVPVNGWTSLGQPLGVAGLGHQALFFAALAFALWMVAMTALAAAVAIPVGRLPRAPEAATRANTTPGGEPPASSAPSNGP